MGYDVAYLLGLVKIPDNIDEKKIEKFAFNIVTKYNEMRKTNNMLPEIGEVDHCGLDGIGDETKESLVKFASKFKETTFVIHCIYFDFTAISSYTFSADGILKEEESKICLDTGIKSGDYIIRSRFDYSETTCDNDLTPLFRGQDYDVFEWRGNLDKVKEKKKKKKSVKKEEDEE